MCLDNALFNFVLRLSSLPTSVPLPHCVHYHVSSESVSHSVVSDSEIPWTVVHLAPLSVEFSRQKHLPGVGSHFLLQRIFLSQGLNQGLLHCRQILYHLNHQGSPFIIIILNKPALRLATPALHTLILLSKETLQEEWGSHP